MVERKLTKKILDFLRWTHEPLFYLHRTSENCARQAIEEGFQFVSWSTTTDPAVQDDHLIEYTPMVGHWARVEGFGDYTIKLGFSRKLFENYNEITKKHPIPGGLTRWDAMFELLCEEKVKGYSSDLFVLPMQFVAGYCVSDEDRTVHNPNFQPDYFDSPANLQILEARVREFSDMVYAPRFGADGTPRLGFGPRPKPEGEIQVPGYKPGLENDLSDF